MGITQQELDKAFVSYGPKYGGVKQDYFALLYLANEFGKQVEDIAHQVAFGNNDFGLDAFHFDAARKNLYLYQFKWSEKHTLFKDSLVRLTNAGMERVFGNPLQVQDQNEMLLQLKASLHENQAIIDRVLIHFVYNGDPEQADGSLVLGSLREDLEMKKYLIDKFFEPNEVTLSFQFLSNESRKKRPQVIKKTHKYSVHMPNLIKSFGPDGQALHVGFVSLLDLHSMYQDMGQRLFDRNIRAGLSDKHPANRAIKRALGRILDGGVDPAEFVFHHNGVTLFAENIDVEDGRMTMTEPRVLNGAQTVTSVARFFENNEKNRALDENRDRLAIVRVLAKVVSKSTDDFTTAVTINTNRQTPVDPANLRASDRTQLELHDKFREALQIFYERQENSFAAMTDSDLEEMGIDQYKAMQIKPLAQTFLAAQGEIDRMSRLPYVFEQEQVYRATFKEAYLTADARRMLLAYKIRFRINRVLKELVDTSAAKYDYFGKARNLVWALLIQGLFNDPKIGMLAETYGVKLVAEADYTERLKGIATKRVAPLMRDAFKADRYQKSIKQEKYSFLKTNAAYQSCMEVAHDRYRWKKLSF